MISLDSVADRDEIQQILDRDTADRQFSNSYGQNDWKQNTRAVQSHIEGLLASELVRPLKKRTSVESVGLIQLVYPGLDRLTIPSLLEEKLPHSHTKKALMEAWPNFVAALLDTVRGDGCVYWSSENESRRWLGQSFLEKDRWLTRNKRGWGSHVFVGATPRQLRRRFTANALKAAGYLENFVDEMTADVLGAVFDQLYDYAGENEGAFSWLRRERTHQTGPEEADRAIQIVMDNLTIQEPPRIYRCQS